MRQKVWDFILLWDIVKQFDVFILVHCDSIVCHAGELCLLLGLPTVEHSLVAAVESLMSDVQWRIRLEVVQQIPQLAKQLVRPFTVA